MSKKIQFFTTVMVEVPVTVKTFSNRLFYTELTSFESYLDVIKFIYDIILNFFLMIDGESDC